MLPVPLSLRLTGATVLRDGMLQNRSVAIEGGVISKGPLPEVDLRGYLVLPGIVDLHGTAFETHRAVAGSGQPALQTLLRDTDRDAAAHGITTAFLSQGWSWAGGLQDPDAAEALLTAHAAVAAQTVIDLRVQLRCEVRSTDTVDRLLACVRRFRVAHVLFADTLEATLRRAEIDPTTLAAAAQRAGRSDATHMAVLQAAATRRAEVPRFLCRLAEAFDTLGVVYGSIGDPDGETRERYAMIGARLCAFPACRPAAALARAVGDPIVCAASAVLSRDARGHAPAEDLIRARLCDALVSDAAYPAPVRAAFTLVDRGVLSLPQAWAMVSAVPADILRLPDRGVIDYGRRADLVVLDPETRRVEATIAGGRIAHLSGEAAHRFFAAGTRLSLAAE